jgi:hypothetical protein
MCGITKVFVVFLSDNTPMRRMAIRAGMAVSTVDGESHAGRELSAATAEELAHWYAEESLAHSRYFGTLGIVHWGSLANRSEGTLPQSSKVLAPTV